MGSTQRALLLHLFLLLKPLLSHAQLSYSSPPSNLYRPNASATVAVIIVVMVTAFFSMVFFSLYLRRCTEDDNPVSHVPSRTRRPARRGLDKAVIDSFPAMVYSEVKELKLGRGSLECAVCLCEFEEAETLRLLPKCSHAFHSECIDMWLDSHTTCPVCRANLSPDPSAPVAAVEPPLHVAIEVEGEEGDRRESETRVEQGQLHPWTEEERERFTLRLPEEVRKEVMGRRLDRSATMALPVGGDGQRGLAKGSRGGWSFKREWAAKSDRWAFLGRTWSLKTPRGRGEGSAKESGETSTAAHGRV